MSYSEEEGDRDETPLDPEDLVFPAPAPWRRYGKNCPCGRFYENDKVYCCYRECDPTMPFFCTFLMTYCEVIYLLAILPRFQNIALQIVATIETFACYILFMWAYYGAACSDPGYLPFDWLKTKRTKYRWDELMDGTVVKMEDFNLIDNLPKPPGSSFSKHSGRYIIRADHICGWIGNWVGKRNHKQFILMTLWGGLAALSYFVWRWIPTKSLKEYSEILFGFEIAAAILEAVFALMLLVSFGQFTMEITEDQTRIQKWKGEATVKKGHIESMKEVCGNGYKCGWICPYHAFSDDLILEDHGEPNIND